MSDVIEVAGNGQFELAVVGEQSYLENFERLFGCRLAEGVDEDCTAILRHEPSNPYDSNSIVVTIGNLVVGYLPRDSAKKVVGSLMRVGRPNAIIRAKARVKGGWFRSDDDQGQFGVLLDFPNGVVRQ